MPLEAPVVGSGGRGRSAGAAIPPISASMRSLWAHARTGGAARERIRLRRRPARAGVRRRAADRRGHRDRVRRPPWACSCAPASTWSPAPASRRPRRRGRRSRTWRWNAPAPGRSASPGIAIVAGAGAADGDLLRRARGRAARLHRGRGLARRRGAADHPLGARVADSEGSGTARWSGAARLSAAPGRPRGLLTIGAAPLSHSPARSP